MVRLSHRCRTALSTDPSPSLPTHSRSFPVLTIPQMARVNNSPGGDGRAGRLLFEADRVNIDGLARRAKTNHADPFVFRWLTQLADRFGAVSGQFRRRASRPHEHSANRKPAKHV